MIFKKFLKRERNFETRSQNYPGNMPYRGFGDPPGLPDHPRGRVITTLRSSVLVIMSIIPSYLLSSVKLRINLWHKMLRKLQRKPEAGAGASWRAGSGSKLEPERGSC